MEQQENMVQSVRVLEFLTVANEYCLLTEESSKYPAETLMAYMHRMLPLLYLKGSLLPDITPTEDELNERHVTEEQWESCFNDLRTVFGKQDTFWHIAHPHDSVPQPEKGSISETLADIYQEMKDFVILYQKPLTASKENAIASCRHFFGEHWGEKASLAGYMIHKILHPCCHNHDEHP